MWVAIGISRLELLFLTIFQFFCSAGPLYEKDLRSNLSDVLQQDPIQLQRVGESHGLTQALHPVLQRYNLNAPQLVLPHLVFIRPHHVFDHVVPCHDLNYLMRTMPTSPFPHHDQQ